MSLWVVFKANEVDFHQQKGSLVIRESAFIARALRLFTLNGEKKSKRKEMEKVSRDRNDWKYLQEIKPRSIINDVIKFSQPKHIIMNK